MAIESRVSPRSRSIVPGSLTLSRTLQTSCMTCVILAGTLPLRSTRKESELTAIRLTIGAVWDLSKLVTLLAQSVLTSSCVTSGSKLASVDGREKLTVRSPWLDLCDAEPLCVYFLLSLVEVAPFVRRHRMCRLEPSLANLRKEHPLSEAHDATCATQIFPLVAFFISTFYFIVIVRCVHKLLFDHRSHQRWDDHLSSGTRSATLHRRLLFRHSSRAFWFFFSFDVMANLKILMRYLRFPRQPLLLAVIWTRYTLPTARDTISRHLYETSGYSISCQYYPHRHIHALCQKGSPLSIPHSRHPTEAPVLTDLQHHSTYRDLSTGSHYNSTYAPRPHQTTSPPDHHALLQWPCLCRQQEQRNKTISYHLKARARP